MKNIQICQPENRNLYNKVFGGFIMRQALELAWANTYMFRYGMMSMSVKLFLIFQQGKTFLSAHGGYLVPSSSRDRIPALL